MRLFAIALALALAGCASVSSSPRLAVAEVIRIADAEARVRSPDYLRFVRAEPRFDPTDQSWWVHYHPPGKRGSRFEFVIRIEEKTNIVSLVLQ